VFPSAADRIRKRRELRLEGFEVDTRLVTLDFTDDAPPVQLVLRDKINLVLTLAIPP
jgi:hypothetical protein